MNNKNLILILGVGLILAAGAYFIITQKNTPGTTAKPESTESAVTKTDDTAVAPACSEVLGTKIVEMKSGGFEPETLTVKKCTRVVFENKDTKDHWPASNIHPTHAIYPELDPQKAVAAGESWSFTFDKVGNWGYHDHLSPSVRGEITVTE